MSTKALIFDMDGLLLDTENLWGQSMMRVAEKNGIEISHTQFKETTGLRIQEVTAYWQRRYPWGKNNAHEVAEEILDDIISSAKSDGRIMPGVEQTILLGKQAGIKIGLASSSPMRMILELLNHYGLTHEFHSICSADNCRYGKPHPEVFLNCAEALMVNPLDAWVLEDSMNGMIAALAARMRVIVVPDKKYRHLPGFTLADHQLNSLEEFTLDLLEEFSSSGA